MRSMRSSPLCSNARRSRGRTSQTSCSHFANQRAPGTPSPSEHSAVEEESLQGGGVEQLPRLYLVAVEEGGRSPPRVLLAEDLVSLHHPLLVTPLADT